MTDPYTEAAKAIEQAVVDAIHSIATQSGQPHPLDIDYEAIIREKCEPKPAPDDTEGAG